MTGRVVRGKELERVRARSGSTRTRLLAGEVIHFPDRRLHFNRKALRERHGVTLHWENDQTTGRYWWVDEKPRSDAERPLEP